MEKLKKTLHLFITFFKIGLFTFGGGYAMIALLQNEMVEKKKWLLESEFYDIVAIAESTPGPIAINMSTFMGYKRAGIFGSIFSTLGVILPSFMIIFLISLFFDKFLSFTYVQYAFKGIQACVGYLILSAGIKMIKGLKKGVLEIILLSLSTITLLTLTLFSIKFSSIFYVLIGGAVTLTAFSVKYFTKKQKQNKGGDKL